MPRAVLDKADSRSRTAGCQAGAALRSLDAAPDRGRIESELGEGGGHELDEDDAPAGGDDRTAARHRPAAGRPRRDDPGPGDGGSHELRAPVLERQDRAADVQRAAGGPEEAPELYAIVQGLAQKAGMPMPKLYVIPDPALNAFATGRSPRTPRWRPPSGIVKAHGPRGAGGRARPRAVPRDQPRHARLDGGRHPGRRDLAGWPIPFMLARARRRRRRRQPAGRAGR